MYDAIGRSSRAWLNRHGLGGPDMPILLTQRLYARQQSQKYLWVTTSAGVLGGLVILQTSSELARLAVLAVVVGSILTVRQLTRHRRSAIEREVAAMLPRRVTHSAPLGTREVLGAGFLGAAALLYLGPALVILAAPGSGPAPGSMLTVLGLIAALAVLDGAEVAAVVHRPALADDARSLAVDDALRTEDARMVLTTPLPTLLMWWLLDLRVAATWPVLTSAALLALLVCLQWAAEHARTSRPLAPA